MTINPDLVGETTLEAKIRRGIEEYEQGKLSKILEEIQEHPRTGTGQVEPPAFGHYKK